ncbi:S-methyl-5-thioribose-1-phosphate isomerase [Candidatus Woesearchaeota archaeon]|nr:S-methyl-5-thioribose-1-phosphate isomerase [Candidatus Woesearchaeota archaeon]
MPYTSFQQVVKDIKELKIQGAEAVSQEGIKSLKIVVLKSKALTVDGFLHEMEKARKELISTRPTEPYLRNSIGSVFNNWEGKTLRELKENVLSKIQQTLAWMQNSKGRVVLAGAKKIKKGMVVFTHCHSSTVVDILVEAKTQGRAFSVHNTETRPKLQGRKTAKELAAAGIKVRHYVDSAARLALKKADIMLIGADAITSEGRVINKIGSELFAEVARKYDIPVYVCTNSWKFDPKTIFGFTEEIEERAPQEVWKNPPKNVTIDNHAFEIINPDLITGVITELGIFEPQVLVEEVKKEYPWMAKQ